MNLTANEWVCFRCGQSLAALTPPLSRRDLCPACSAELHVCMMCEHFAPQMTGACREEDAEEVLDKKKANFCEWFSARLAAYDAGAHAQSSQAQSALRALFEDSTEAPSDETGSSAAEDLFK